MDSWEVVRASAKPQASWEHLRDETRSETWQSGAVAGFSLYRLEMLPVLPVKRFSFYFVLLEGNKATALQLCKRHGMKTP